MDYVHLGSSGLVSSVIGLGGGSSSRFGLTKGGTRSDALKLIHRGLDLGITFFDGAGVCGGGVNELLRDGLSSSRDGVLLSTKIHLGPAPIILSDARRTNQASSWIARRFGLVCSASTLRARVEQTLKTLRTDRIDVLHLHAVSPAQYPSTAELAIPLLLRMKQEGKLRAIGITEQYLRDSEHKMLRYAVENASFDTIMVGFSFGNRSAADFVLPAALEHGTGVIGMFGVRGVCRAPDHELNEIIAQTGAAGFSELAYRYCRQRRGIDVVLTGTGDAEHLQRNVEAALSPPLPEQVLRRLEAWSDRQSHADASTLK
jgi:aryl-alcohol dehydrogenase-like predicted oxidoreductase